MHEIENALNPTPIPLPVSLPLLASALAGFGAWRRWARQTAKRKAGSSKIAVIFALLLGSSPVAQAAPALTSIQLGAFNATATEWACWSAPTGCAYSLFLAEGSATSTIINAGSTLNAGLSAGNRTFYFFGDYDSDDRTRQLISRAWTLRLSFDGNPMQGFIDANSGVQDIAARTMLNKTGTLFASNPLQAPYAGALRYQTADWSVTLTDFNLTFFEPTGFDRVAPFGVFPNGRDDAVGSFTLQVQQIPVPASLPLLASALAGFAAWRRFVTRQA
jgi:hypothetical protein